MKCKHCKRKVLTLRDGYCGPCKRLFGDQFRAEENQTQDRIKELELELIKIEWQFNGRWRG
jgi:hypothetical protein